MEWILIEKFLTIKKNKQMNKKNWNTLKEIYIFRIKTYGG